MAGDKVNTYAQDDSDILALQLTTDKTFKGYHQLTLTEYDTTTVPAIAAGSVIECNGALYKFDTEEAISTTDPVTSSTVADGTVYVCIVPDTTTATAAFTATAPTWSDSKQGWYGTGGQANYRYAEYLMTKATAAYSKGTFDSFKKSCVNVTMTTNQTLSSTSPVKIQFNSIIHDSKDEFDATTNYRFTPKNLGYYLITGGLYRGTSSATILIYKNGLIIEDSKISVTLETGFASFSYLALLNSGDYIEVWCDGSADTAISSMSARLNIIQVA